MPIEVIRYINTNSPSGGNGTTDAISGGSRAYTSIANAITGTVAENPNFVTSDVNMTVLCAGGIDSGAVLIQPPYGIITDQTRRLTFAANVGQEARIDMWDTTIYRYNPLPIPGEGSPGITIRSISDIGFRKLQIGGTASSSLMTVIDHTISSGSLIIDGCRFNLASTASVGGNTLTLALVRGGSKLFARNSLFETTGPGRLDRFYVQHLLDNSTFTATSGSGAVYNCLFYGSSSAAALQMNIFKQVVVRNNIFIDAAVNNPASFGQTGSNNIVRNGVQQTGSVSHPHLGQHELLALFVNPLSGNWTPIPSKCAGILLNTGFDLRSDPTSSFPVTSSMNGAERDGFPDIGPVEMRPLRNTAKGIIK